MTKLSYVRLVTSFVKSLTHFVGVYGGVSGVKAIPGDPRGETFICRYPTGFVDFKAPCTFYSTDSHGVGKNCVISVRRS